MPFTKALNLVVTNFQLNTVAKVRDMLIQVIY